LFGIKSERIDNHKQAIFTQISKKSSFAYHAIRYPHLQDWKLNGVFILVALQDPAPLVHLSWILFPPGTVISGTDFQETNMSQ